MPERYHAWLDPTGALPEDLTPPQRDLATLWPRWVVGRSPFTDVDHLAAAIGAETVRVIRRQIDL